MQRTAPFVCFVETMKSNPASEKRSKVLVARPSDDSGHTCFRDRQVPSGCYPVTTENRVPLPHSQIGSIDQSDRTTDRPISVVSTVHPTKRNIKPKNSGRTHTSPQGNRFYDPISQVFEHTFRMTHPSQNFPKTDRSGMTNDELMTHPTWKR